jgi:hypothetical protein
LIQQKYATEISERTVEMHLPSLLLRCHLHIVLQGNQGREGSEEEAQGDLATWLYSRLFEADQQLTQTIEGKGDHLALPPFCSSFFPGTPFKSIAEVVDCKIILIHLCPKPLAFRISMIVECSILSKAFSKSNFRTIISSLDLWH